jgi:hypothetical protein
LEKRRRCLAALSNDQLVRLGSILVTIAERLAESVDCDVDASLEGTKRLEQEFSRVRRTLNNNDTNDRFTGKITRLLNQVLDSPVVEPKVTDTPTEANSRTSQATDRNDSQHRRSGS